MKARYAFDRTVRSRDLQSFGKAVERTFLPGRYAFAAFSALFLLLGSLSQIRAGTLLFSESFENASAPGWTFTGNASLTGGTSDPAGQGWLRLTSNATN